MMARPARIGVSVVDLLAAPGGTRDRQLLFGAAVEILDQRDGHAHLRAAADGYEGFVPDWAIQPDHPTSHFVATRATHAYQSANLKSPETIRLSHGSDVLVTSESPEFLETPQGFIPKSHLLPLSDRHADPIETAKLFLGAPYLWGGNSDLGIDCSGLVQAALRAASIPCPGDSDQQVKELGKTLAEDAVLQPLDLLFWKGHVAIVVTPDTLIHANGTHMAVVFEGVDQAIARIKAAGEGEVTRRARLT